MYGFPEYGPIKTIGIRQRNKWLKLESLNNEDKSMKKIIVAVIIMVFIPISYVGAEDKETVDPAKDKNLMPLNGYLPLPVKRSYAVFKERMTKENEKADYLDCIKGQRRIVRYGRMIGEDEETKPYRGYNSNIWITIQCMENKEYTGMKHKVFEYPYPDYN